MALQAPAISDGQANTIRGAGFGGLVKLAVGSTEVAFDVSAWQNQMIRITAEGDDCYYKFAESSAATIDPALDNVTSAATPSVDVPGLIPIGTTFDVGVPITSNTSSRTYLATGKIFLIVRARSATADVRVHRS